MSEQLEKARVTLKQDMGWNSEDVAIIRSLGTGSSNDVWLIEYQSKKYALRIDKPFAKKLPLDRHNEISIQKILAGTGLSPQIVFSNFNNGILLSEYIDGRTWDDSDFNNKDQLSLLAAHLKKLHSLSPQVNQYNLAGGIKMYAKQLNQKQSDTWASEALTLLSQMTDRPLVVCHNDLHPQNIIETKTSGQKRLWFIDLEYSGLGNPIFDVSTVINHQLTDDLSEHFLKAYFGKVDLITRSDLELQRKINDRLLVLWYSVLLENDPDDTESKLLLNDVLVKINLEK